jgi:quinol monooxygenase YgiN
MLVVKAQLTIAVEYKNAFLQQIDTLIQHSLGESGCISFGCYADVAAPTSHVVLAEWENSESLARHEQSAHVMAFKNAVREMIEDRRETMVYEVSRVDGLSRYGG